MGENASENLFDQRPEVYDTLIDWPRRLANEQPFYRRLFAQVGVNSVLDVACGTGRHADMFHSWGLRVEGADVSSAMIALCRENFGRSESLRWVQRSFEQPCDSPGSFDAVICVGNSLAICADIDGVGRVLRAMFAALRPGGVCVVQMLNLWRFPEGPITWQKCKRVRCGGTTRILLKGIHRIGSRGFVEIAYLTIDGDEVVNQADTRPILGAEAGELTAAAKAAGATDIQLYGGYHDEPYNREHSQDLILVARR